MPFFKFAANEIMWLSTKSTFLRSRFGNRLRSLINKFWPICLIALECYLKYRCWINVLVGSILSIIGLAYQSYPAVKTATSYLVFTSCKHFFKCGLTKNSFKKGWFVNGSMISIEKSGNISF
jgi:hypothetical protein